MKDSKKKRLSWSRKALSEFRKKKVARLVNWKDGGFYYDDSQLELKLGGL